MKYKVGDKVRVVSKSIVDSKPLSFLGNPHFKTLFSRSHDTFVPQMRKYCGREVVISEVRAGSTHNKYRIEGCEFYFTRNMFIP